MRTFNEWFNKFYCENAIVYCGDLLPKAAWDYQQKVIDKKDAEIEKLKEALGYYAGREAWLRHEYMDVANRVDCEDLDRLKGYAERCGGKLARAVLKEVENG